MANSNAGRSVPLAEAPLYRETECEPWGFWASLLWSGFALGLFYGFDSFEHTLLRGTAFGRLIGESFALGALNSLVEWSNPLVILLVAIRIRGCPVLDYFAWIRPRAGDVVLGIVLAVVLQVLSYGVPYLLVGADITANAIAQYRAEAAAGTPHWVPVLLSWPGILAAPFVEESVFRGFMCADGNPGWARWQPGW